jgi:hypothetical protein
MAKINFEKHLLTDLKGKPIRPQKVENGVLVDDMTKDPRTIAETICLNLNSEDGKVTPEKRYKYFKLAEKISNAGGEVELTLEELTMIKEKIGEHPHPNVVGRVWDILESLQDNKE